MTYSFCLFGGKILQIILKKSNTLKATFLLAEVVLQRSLGDVDPITDTKILFKKCFLTQIMT